MVYKVDADGSNVQRLTYAGDYNASPSWSPAGGKLAFGEAEIIHQRDMAGAYETAGAAFDAVEQVLFFQSRVMATLRVPMQLLGQQLHRADGFAGRQLTLLAGHRLQ